MVFVIISIGDNMKKGILIIVTLIIISLVTFFSFNYVKNKNLISKEKKVGDVIFSNAKIKKDGNKFSFSVTVKCIVDQADIDSFDAVIKNKKGKELDVLSGYVGGIKSGETKIIHVKSDKDLSHAYEINYTVYKQ